MREGDTFPASETTTPPDAEKKKILYIVEAMGGGVFTYIVGLSNELVNEFDMYIAYAVRPQTPANYREYFDPRIHLIEVKSFGRAIDLRQDLKSFSEVLGGAVRECRSHSPSFQQGRRDRPRCPE